MSADWKQVPLSDLASLSGGFAFRSKDYASSGRFILRTLNIRDDGAISKEDAVYLPEDLCDQYLRFELQPEDTLFVMVGATLGKVGFVRQSDLPALLNQNMWRVRAKPEAADQRFLHYAFRHGIQKNLAWAAGSARDFALRDDYRNLLIPTPPMEEQRAIGQILGALDDKIDLNRRMNRTLEELATTLFRSWFVDFNPVVAKAAGRKPVHLDPEVAALFPAHFQESELGSIPHGWRARPVTELIDFNPIRRLSKGTSAPYLDMQNMPTDSALPHQWVTRPHGSGMKFQNGDTLLARITPCLENGKTAFVNALGDGEVGWGSTEYIVMRSKPPLPLEYSYFLARSDEFRSHAIVNMTGSSGRQRVATTCFEHFLVAEPSNEIADAFGNLVAPFMRMMKTNVEESRTLASLRDTLLPKLLSGELRVKQAEKRVATTI